PLSLRRRRLVHERYAAARYQPERRRYPERYAVVPRSLSVHGRRVRFRQRRNGLRRPGVAGRSGRADAVADGGQRNAGRGIMSAAYGAAAIVAAVLASVVGLLLVRRVVPLHVLQEQHEVAGVTFAVIGGFYGIVLAFVLVASGSASSTRAPTLKRRPTRSA